MKSKCMKRILSFALALLLVLSFTGSLFTAAAAETVTVSNTIAGRLSSAAPANGVDSSTVHLTVTGKLNAADLTYLNTLTQLQHLDLSGARYNVSTFPRALQGLQNLRTVRLPSGIQFLAPRSLEGLARLEEIAVPDGVVHIRAEAFYNCTALKHVYLPDSVTTIGERAFMDCRQLLTIHMPANLSTILREAFHNCISLKWISIPKSVTSIGDSAFNSCPPEAAVFESSVPPQMGTNVFTPGQLLYVPLGSEEAYRDMLDSAPVIIQGAELFRIEISNNTAHSAYPAVSIAPADLPVPLTAITNTEPVYSFMAMDPANLSISNRQFTMPGQNVQIRYGIARNIEEVVSPRGLYLQEGSVISTTGLLKLMADIQSAEVFLDNGETDTLPLLAQTGATGEFTGWKLQKDEGYGWTDVEEQDTEELLSNAENAPFLRLIACVDPGDTGYVMPEPYLYIEVPLDLYSRDEHPLQLTEGNNDLYWDSDTQYSPTSYILRRMKISEPELTKEDFKTDLVFYLAAENYAEHIAGHMGAGGLKSLYGETDFSGFEDLEEDRSIRVFQLNPDDSDIALYKVGEGIVDYIEPCHSPFYGDYLVPEKAGGVKRLTERYKAVYAVQDGYSLYVASRAVKLRYMPGDTDGDLEITENDARRATLAGVNSFHPFVGIPGVTTAEEYQKYGESRLHMLDFNGDGAANAADGTLISQCARGQEFRLRWCR